MNINYKDNYHAIRYKTKEEEEKKNREINSIVALWTLIQYLISSYFKT